jgi:hypothetical protein
LVASGIFLLSRKRPVDASSIATVNAIFTGSFDSVFRRNCPGVPVPYLRALAKHESDFNPLDAEGPAHGLLQVVEKVRIGFNDRFGTSFSRADLLNPEINATIACELIARIARVLPANHPRSFPVPSWLDPRFVGLVTFAWNAGFSEAAGMGFVIGEMERAGFRSQDINIESVHNFAQGLPPEKGRFLRIDQRLEFSQRVVRDYMAQISQA